LEEGLAVALAVLVLPEPYRVRWRTTNGLERLNAARERNKKVAVHPCREHLCVPDASRAERWHDGSHVAIARGG